MISPLMAVSRQRRQSSRSPLIAFKVDSKAQVIFHFIDNGQFSPACVLHQRVGCRLQLASPSRLVNKAGIGADDSALIDEVAA